MAGSLPDQLDLSSLGKVGLDLEPRQLLGWLNRCLRAVVSAENIRVVKEADVFKEGQQFWSPASQLLSLFSSLIPNLTVSSDLVHKSVYLKDIANSNLLCPIQGEIKLCQCPYLRSWNPGKQASAPWDKPTCRSTKSQACNMVSE